MVVANMYEICKTIPFRCDRFCSLKVRFDSVYHFEVAKMEEATTTTSRDAKKKKILQKGSDRIDFITGRASSIESLPQSHVLAEIEPDTDDDSIGIRTSRATDSNYISGISRGSTSMIPNDVNDKEICAMQPKDRNARFSARKISSCIIASEPTRSICSLTIALLVVFSYIDKPVLGWNLVKSESIVASRPLYILLLTDLSIIFTRLHIERRKILEYGDEGETTTSASREGQTWDSAVTVLENGLVVYQTIRAVFIDFSIYTVVVVLGLSFV